jgi:4-hydroxy-3-polyprenylbenzoate decarboxylase
MRCVVAITGASGCRYGLRLTEILLRKGCEVNLLISSAGEKVLKWEENLDIEGKSKKEKEKVLKRFFKQGKLIFYEENDLDSPLSSGSFHFDSMIIIPASMSTVASISHGISKNLIHRVAEVTLKQERKLILVPRETPLSLIHLKNLLKAKEAGASIVPAMPAFYPRPKSIEEMVDFVVGKVLEVLGLEHNLYRPWKGSR